MRELIAHAMWLGVSVLVAHIDGPQRGFYDSDRGTVVYDYRLTPVEQRCVVAHELGHAFYDHHCRGVASAEDDADYYAASLLIEPQAYANAARLGLSTAAIAEELGVEERLVTAWESRLLRLDGVTYARARMGAGQFAWRAFA